MFATDYQKMFRRCQYIPLPAAAGLGPLDAACVVECRKISNAYRFLQSQDRAREIQHVSQNDMQVALEAALGGAARLVGRVPIQKGFAQHSVKVLAVSCNHAVQVCGSLQHHWLDGVNDVVL